MFMPGARFAHAEFWNENIHFGVELDQDLVRVVVVTCQIVTCRVAARTPFRFDPCPTEFIASVRVRGAVLQLKGDVMDSGFRNVDDVDDVVIAIAGKKGRYAFKLVGVPKSEEFFVELSGALLHVG